jgi:hypothetical protein
MEDRRFLLTYKTKYGFGLLEYLIERRVIMQELSKIKGIKVIFGIVLTMLFVLSLYQEYGTILFYSLITISFSIWYKKELDYAIWLVSYIISGLIYLMLDYGEIQTIPFLLFWLCVFIIVFVIYYSINQIAGLSKVIEDSEKSKGK